MQAEFVEEQPGYLREDKRKAIIAFGAIMFVDTFLTWVLGRELQAFYPIQTLAYAIGAGLALFYWCRADSRMRGFTLPKHFPLAIVVLGFLTLMWYLFKTRGFKGMLVTGGKGFLLLLAMAVTSGVLATLLDLISDRTGSFN